MERYYIGMDLHKLSTTFCVLDKEGRLIQEATVKTCKEEIKKIIVGLGKKKELELVVEPVSQSHCYIDFLESLGVNVTLCHPTKVQAIASGKAKTDKIDARILADLLRTNMIPTAYHPPKEIRLWRELSRARNDLVEEQTAMKNQIHALLFRNGLEYSKAKIWTGVGMKWLKEIKFDRIFKLKLDSKLNILESLKKEIKILEKEIEATVKVTRSMELLCTIPGISKVTAIMIMSEIGEISRFPNERKLHSYAGLVPVIRSSGGRISYGHISKAGSKYLRYILVQVAQHQKVLKHKIGLKWFYDGLIAKNKSTKTATVATARKLLTIVYKVLKENRPFEERLPKTVQSI
jgi:transposase